MVRLDHDAGRPPADKFDERRDQLAESALRTLGELGYARTSLREIANNSEFSHGVVHYYFARQARADGLLRALLQGPLRDPLRRGRRRRRPAPAGWSTAFAAKLVETIRDEAPMHRLWYDLRTQSMFEDRACATRSPMIDKTLEEMIWRVVRRYAELAGRPPARTPRPRTACWTGCSSRRCFGHLTGRADALDELVTAVRELMPYLLAP